MSASKRICKKMFQTKQYGEETRNRKPEIYCCCCILRAWPSSASHFIFFFSLFLLWPVQDAQQLWFVVFPSFFFKRTKQSARRPALFSPRYNMREREGEFVLHNISWEMEQKREKKKLSSSSSCTTKLHTLWMTATHPRHLAAVVVAAAASPAVQTGPASSRSSAGFQPAKRLC